MKVSVSWLCDYVPVDMDINRLVDALTMVGLEVDAVFDRYDYLNSVLTGKILDIAAHPNADKLKICTVDIGKRRVRVICGAPNADKGLTVATALPGTELPSGAVLTKTDIRGEVSEGMLGSEMELGLGPDRSGIMTLGAEIAPGTPVAKALNLSDMVMDIDLTPNRPDCLSIIGIAREVAAIQGTRVRYPDFGPAEPAEGPIEQMTSVTIESPEHCPRYVARLIEGITVSESPFWLQNRLLSVGMRPINNVVDITNFVMMETGQPLHAFDFDRLAGNRIVVRCAQKDELFTTLDEKEHRLSDQMLMICDGEKPVAIAGVMGGFNSEIIAGTHRVLLESAYFTPMSIRRTSKALGVNTDASHRFERGVDPEGTLAAANRAARLMAEISNGRVVPGTIDARPVEIRQSPLALRFQEVNDVLGIDLDGPTVKRLLESIEFTVSDMNDMQMTVMPPSHRVDVSRPIDLMEEVARLHGYQNIPTTFPRITPQKILESPGLALRKRVKRLMTAMGFSEAVNYSFLDQRSLDHLNVPDDDVRRKTVRILNPLTEDQTDMRTTLMHGLLQTMHRNVSRQEGDLKLFEVGKVFYNNTPGDLPAESEMLAGLWSGARAARAWHTPLVPCDYYDMKGVVEELFRALKIRDLKFTRMPAGACHHTRPGYTARIQCGPEEIGVVGELHPDVNSHYDLKQTAFVFEINLDALMPRVPETVTAQPLPKFPSVSRDATLIVEKGLDAHEIIESVMEMEEKLIEQVRLFDVFEGNQVPKNKKSVSFRITYRSMERTLADEEVNRLHESIADRVIRKYNAALPT